MQAVSHLSETRHHQTRYLHEAVCLLVLLASPFSSGPAPVVTQHFSPCLYLHAAQFYLTSIGGPDRGGKIKRRAHRLRWPVACSYDVFVFSGHISSEL